MKGTSYCSQLKEILKRNIETVRTFVRQAHANAYGLRKGGATFATAGTTCPPDTITVARRGEWFLGKTIDVYLHFAEPGDCFLGRTLACLDALQPNFKVLPPHFTIENPLEKKEVSETMSLMYGPIIQKWGGSQMDPTGLLLRLLASVIHHFDWIKKMANTRTDHPFNAIPLMFCPEIVTELKTIVSIEPSMVISEATGIPPHVEHSIKLHTLLTVENECLSLLERQVDDIKKVSLNLF